MVVKHIVSLERYEITKDGRVYDKKTNKWSKSHTDKDGYIYYCITDKNGKHKIPIHRLLAQTYCNDWFDGCVVHHIDGNKNNNSIENLKCMTCEDHVKLHNVLDLIPLQKVCPKCGNLFTWSIKSQLTYIHNRTYQTKNNNIVENVGPFCSSSCALKWVNAKRIQKYRKCAPACKH